MKTTFEDLNRMTLIYEICDKLYKLYDKDIQSYVVAKDNAKKTFKLTKKEMRQIESIIEE
ncbi:MAG: hypothetical protein E6240_01660 [Clostridium butyricum]|nr:hypothetical protein [Clostridium butyricum]